MRSSRQPGLCNATRCPMSDGDGGPAFARTGEWITGEMSCADSGTKGMSLRDYFAASALQGAMAGRPQGPDGYYVDPRGVAVESYKIADAMLAARKRSGEQ